MRIFRRQIILMFLLLIVSQKNFGQASAGFYIETGSIVPFSFSSFAKLQNGITYTDWTTIRIKMQELTVDATDTFALGWTLSFRALTATIEGDRGVPADNLPLNTIRLSSADDSPNPPQFIPIALTDLTNAYQTLASATGGLHVPNSATVGDPDETILKITFECGANNAGCPAAPCNMLFGREPDIYTVDIELLITVP